MTSSKRKNFSGFSLIELLIGVVVFSAISAGAYKIYTNTTRTATISQQQSKQERAVKQFIERFRQHVENAQQINTGAATMLKLLRPNHTGTGSRECVQAPDELATELPTGLVPFPGMSLSTVPNNFTPFEPSAATANETTNPNDAVRMAYAPEDSVTHPLVSDSASWNDARAKPTMGTFPISIAAPATGLSVGDYAIVSDASRQDLIRITAITIASGIAEIYHTPANSIWNSLWLTAYQTSPPNNFSDDNTYNYGQGPGSYATAPGSPLVGRPVIYRVKLEDYALDTATHNLMVNDHMSDDGFIPPSTWGTPGLNPTWQVVVPGVTKFQLYYALMNGNETRTPQIGMPAVVNYDNCSVANHHANCGCDNQLGNPSLKNIRIAMEFTKPKNAPSGNKTIADTASGTFNPIVLKKAPPNVGADAAGCNAANVLWTTLSDGSPNPDCGTPRNCHCTPRPPASLCATPGVGICNTAPDGPGTSAGSFGGEGAG